MQLDDEPQSDTAMAIGVSVEARIEAARGLLLEAMLDVRGWEAALRAVALACGARAGQLICLNGEGAVSDHFLTGVPEGFAEEIEAFGLINPMQNPRMRIGAAAPLMHVVADQDFVDAGARARSPIYAEMFEPHDLPFNCQVVLMRDRERLVRASITRTRKQGPLDDNAFRVFSALAPHLQAAVRVQAALIAAKCTATLQALDAVAAAAFLLAESGRVIGVSAEAEKLASIGEVIQIAGGRLRPRAQADQAAFEARLAHVLGAARNAYTEPLPALHLCASGAVLEVQPLPRESFLGAGAAALVIVRPAARPDERAEALQRAFALTPAEAAVTVALGDGVELASIARQRGVAITTVRSQIQSIYAKMDVHRQTELVAAMRRLGTR